ncbi:hypothetical protein ACN79_02530 [Escherichia coli]|nr:hypothetical protein ACN79_02530 [Escherichia coli]
MLHHVAGQRGRPSSPVHPYGKMASWLVEWKNATETQWLKDSPSQPLQQSLKDLERLTPEK